MNSILKKLILRYECKELYNLQLYYERRVNDLKESVVKGVNEIRREQCKGSRRDRKEVMEKPRSENRREVVDGRIRRRQHRNPWWLGVTGCRWLSWEPDFYASYASRPGRGEVEG